MGKARSGKDTFAQHLVDHHGFFRVAFADSVREMLLDLDPLIGKGALRVSDLVEFAGWEGAKAHPEVRLLLQRLGTDAVRTRSPHFWVAEAERRAKGHGRVVFTDVRFMNEVDFVQTRGILVKLERPSVDVLDTTDAHTSERLADREDLHHYRVLNAGPVDALGRTADGLVRVLATLPPRKAPR